MPHNWPRLGSDPHSAALKLTSSSFSYTDSSYWTDGPYQIQKYDPAASGVVLKPMKFYRVHSGPHVSTVILLPPYHSSADLASAVAGGEADVAADYGAIADVAAFIRRRSAYSTLVTPSFDAMTVLFNLDTTYLGLNNMPKPNPLRSERIRQALALALDRATIAADALGVSVSLARKLMAYTPFLVTPQITQAAVGRTVVGSWDPIAHRFIPYGPRALSDARLLLRQAGFASGLTIDVLGESRHRRSPAAFRSLAKNWEAVGVHTRLSTWGADEPCRMLPLRAGAFQVYLGEVVGDADPDNLDKYLDSRFASRPARARMPPCADNVSDVKDPLIDTSFRRAVATFDLKQRTHWYTEIQAKLSKRAYWAPLYYVPNIIIHNRHVRGVTGYPLPGISPFMGYAWNAFQWRYVT